MKSEPIRVAVEDANLDACLVESVGRVCATLLEPADRRPFDQDSDFDAAFMGGDQSVDDPIGLDRVPGDQDALLRRFERLDGNRRAVGKNERRHRRTRSTLRRTRFVAVRPPFVPLGPPAIPLPDASVLDDIDDLVVVTKLDPIAGGRKRKVALELMDFDPRFIETGFGEFRFHREGDGSVRS